MSDVAIRVRGLSKQYRIRPRERYKLLSDRLNALLAAPLRPFGFGRDGRSGNPQSAIRSPETIWALKDVSFDVKPGEVVGIIGRNGAGKTTLLKILSRITEPTEGEVEVYGRVGSLLEVGTGFHPELTGRENIYLNGAILGMTKAEIERRFDEIVHFAEIEDFLDTPVKHYSSGMYTRLAFSVAAHLDPEVLLVDEVLAVGDLAFQKKCLRKMGDLSKGGRTVLFVSHNIEAVRRLCEALIVLDAGLTIFRGKTEEGVGTYLQLTTESPPQDKLLPIVHDVSDGVTFLSLELLDHRGKRRSSFSENEPISLQIEYRASRRVVRGIIGFRITAQDGSLVFVSHWDDTGLSPDINPGTHKIRATIPQRMLMPGRYFIWLGSVDSGFRALAATREIATFEVAADCDLNSPLDRRPGYIRPPILWEV